MNRRRVHFGSAAMVLQLIKTSSLLSGVLSTASQALGLSAWSTVRVDRIADGSKWLQANSAVGRH